MKRTLLALAIAGLSVAASASPPPGGGPPTPINVNVVSAPAPSVDGGVGQQIVGTVCWADTVEEGTGKLCWLDFKTLMTDEWAVGKIWGATIQTLTDSIDNNCNVRFIVADRGGLTQYELGMHSAGPGYSSVSYFYPVLIQINTPEDIQLGIVVSRRDVTKVCKASAYVNVAP